jgi:hypothetical protein
MMRNLRCDPDHDISLKFLISARLTPSGSTPPGVVDADDRRAVLYRHIITLIFPPPPLPPKP